MPPDYGAIGFHFKGREWFANLYMWRRGPWRFSITWHRWGVAFETPMLNNFFSRAIVDTLWGLKRRKEN